MGLFSSIKMLLRSPAKTLITFLLLVATSFAFVSRGVEYAATVRQINAAESQYSAVGTAEKSLQGYNDYMTETLGAERLAELENGVYIDRTDKAVVPLSDDVLDILAVSDFIEVSETRLVSGGTHSDCWSVLEQPLSDLENFSASKGSDSVGTFAMYDALFIAENGWDRGDGYMEDFMRETLVAYQDTMHISQIQTGNIWDGDSRVTIVDDCFYYEVQKVGRRNAANSEFWDSFSGNLQKGDIILFAATGYGNTRALLPCIEYPLINVSRIEREYGKIDIATILQNPTNYNCNRYIVSAESNQTTVLGRDLLEFIPIPRGNQNQISAIDYFTTINRNHHTSEVVYTSDMKLIHKVHDQKMYPSDGRFLTAEDSGDVCVIGADFAEYNGLSVGDHITLDLCADTLVHSGKVFGRETPYPTDRDVIGENQLTERNLENVTKTFEIVGIWSDSDFDVEDPFTYALNTIFVPESCYPWQGEVEPSALPSTLSFRLKDPGDVAAIEAELGDKLVELGYELSINDGGYAAAKPNLDFMKLTALIAFIGMSLALILALILITYLFVVRKKKDYAIMRALGTTRGKSNRSMLSALLAMSLVAIAVGAVIAGIVEQSSTARMAADVAKITGEVAQSDGAWGLTALFASGTLVLVWLFARVGLVKISRTPPLELLQGSGR